MHLSQQQLLFTQGLDPYSTTQQFRKACELIDRTGQLSAEEGLLVYRHNITGALQDVLAQVFPICLLILGEECFDAMVRDYAWDPGSECADLDDFGEHFPQFIKKQLQEQPSLAELLYLPDLAQLEWLYHRAHTAEDDIPFDTQNISALLEQPDDVTVVLSKSLLLYSSAYPIFEIWQANQNDAGETSIPVPETTQHLLLYRNMNDVEIHTIETKSCQFLRGCQNGLPLSTLAEELEDHAEATFIRIPEMIKSGWIVGFRILDSMEPI